MKAKITDPIITLQIEGNVEACTILQITPDTVALSYKDKIVYMSHTNFNFMLLHGEIDWRLGECEKDGKTVYFLV